MASKKLLEGLNKAIAMDLRATIQYMWQHETCPGRSKEGAKMLSDFWSRCAEWEKKGVKILGAWVTVTGHAYYIVVQSKDFAAVTEFFLPLCPTQTGDFVPVLTMDEWITMNQPK